MSAPGRETMVAIGVDGGAGLSGKALQTGRVQITDDYLEDERSRTTPSATAPRARSGCGPRSPSRSRRGAGTA